MLLPFWPLRLLLLLCRVLICLLFHGLSVLVSVFHLDVLICIGRERIPVSSTRRIGCEIVQFGHVVGDHAIRFFTIVVVVVVFILVG
ncbi:hypothetical protein GE09DRAFT_1095848, partial [Coniochaeta sp. 2T2.1]